MAVKAIDDWSNNAEMIKDVGLVHYRPGETVLDTTWGLGNFWSKWAPKLLDGCDYDVKKSPMGISVDVTEMPFSDASYDIVVCDLPYKYAGTATPSIDGRYGVAGREPVADTDERMQDGLVECCRVARRQVWFKCQDQVVSGRLRLQTAPLIVTAAEQGFRVADIALLQSYREQPAGRRQLHLRRNYSTLLIFERTGKIKKH